MGTSTPIKSRRKWTLLMTGEVGMLARCSCSYFVHTVSVADCFLCPVEKQELSCFKNVSGES